MPFDHSHEHATGQALFCHNCERAVPDGAGHCPYCCGEDGQQGAAKRRAFIGGMVGLMAGGVVAAICSSVIGPEGGSWGVVLGIAASGTTAGAMLGVFGRSGRLAGRQN